VTVTRPSRPIAPGPGVEAAFRAQAHHAVAVLLVVIGDTLDRARQDLRHIPQPPSSRFKAWGYYSTSLLPGRRPRPPRFAGNTPCESGRVGYSSAPPGSQLCKGCRYSRPPCWNCKTARHRPRLRYWHPGRSSIPGSELPDHPHLNHSVPKGRRLGCQELFGCRVLSCLAQYSRGEDVIAQQADFGSHRFRTSMRHHLAIWPG
jgi:hypothetical protein